MKQHEQDPMPCVEFGSYLLDLGSGELRCGGLPVRLAPQPAQVLVHLVRNAGRLVTRDELRELLWGDRYVDHDQGLNTCIRQIRGVLGDSVEQPLYVETEPKRGYRFIAPVQSQQADPAPAPPRLWLRWASAVALAALVLALLVGFVGKPRDERKPGPPPGERSIVVVLPFTTPGNAPDDRIFADGLTEELIAELAMLHPQRLGVIARTSAMSFRDTDRTAREVGEALGAGYLVEGSVRRNGDDFRIVAQLVRVGDQSHLWAQRFDRTSSDPLALQLEVAARVAASLAPELLASTRRPRRHDRAAQIAYLEGRHWLRASDTGAAKAAWRLFERALELDPSMGEAWIGVALARRAGGDDSGRHGERRALQRAIELDPDLAEAHRLLGNLRLFTDWDFAAAERSLRRAVDLEPGSAESHHALAQLLAVLRRHDEAIRHFETALELDPVSSRMHGDGATIYFAARRYEKAIELCERGLRGAMRPLAAHRCLLDNYLQLGQLQPAAREARASLELGGADTAVVTRFDHSRDREAALELYFAWNLEQMQSSGTGGVALAAAYLHAGDLDAAFASLEDAYARHSPNLLFVNADPRCDPHRHDPRLVDLVKRIGLPS